MNGRASLQARLVLAWLLMSPLYLLTACSPTVADRRHASPTAGGTALVTSPRPAEAHVGPSARFGASMALDAATGMVVLFGGQNQGYLGDTWTWDGRSWKQEHPAASPPPRRGAAMAYDAARKTLVLFGGEGNVFPFRIGHLSDTWVWNGTTWVEQHPPQSPSARSEANIAYDGAMGTVVLFGETAVLGRPNATRRRAWLVFVDESGFSLLPSVRATWAPKGQTPVLRHQFRHWVRASAVTAVGYRWDGQRARLYFHTKIGADNDEALIRFLRQLRRRFVTTLREGL